MRRIRNSGSIEHDSSRERALVLLKFRAICLIFASASSALAQTIVPTNQIALFNGRNLAGFYTWLVDAGRNDPRRVFSVANGMIRISGEGLGYLATHNSYENYKLLAEFKWGRTNWHWGNRIGAARDSGIFLHASGPDGNSYDGHGAFKAALECQIMQGAVGDLLLIRGTNAPGELIAPTVTADTAHETDRDGWPYWDRAGQPRTITRWGRLNWFGKDHKWKDQLGFRGAHDVESTEGEWTRLACICDRDQISIFVNETLVNQARHALPSSGQILLQCEGSEIFFRKLELHPLTKSAREQ